MDKKVLRHVVFALAMVLGVLAFIFATIAVWQPSNSQAREGFGGTAMICGFTGLLCAMVGSMWSEW